MTLCDGPDGSLRSLQVAAVEGTTHTVLRVLS